jgi:TRAP-type C4-dicarboxylate transport system permease small subunit
MKKFLDHIEEYTLIGTLWTLLIMVFVQVILRYFYRVTWNWIEEVARFLFLWMVWLGAGYAAKCRAHLRIEAFISKLTPGARSGAEFVSLVIWIVFAVFLTWTGGRLTWMLIRRNQLSPVLQIPMAWAYASVPAGVGLMTIHLCRQFWDIYWRGRFRGEEAE